MKTWTIDDFPSVKWKPQPVVYKDGGRWIFNWFSNFSPTPIVIDGLTYKSVENWYQANKAIDEDDYVKIMTATINGSKQLGKKIKIREDWAEVRFNVMFKGLVAKVEQHPDFMEKLRETKDLIIEWNNWNDKVWGVDHSTGLGRNALGIQLMYLRDYHE